MGAHLERARANGRQWVLSEPAFVALRGFCRSPALGAIRGGLRDFSQRGRRSYKAWVLFLVSQPANARKAACAMLPASTAKKRRRAARVSLRPKPSVPSVV